MEKIEPEIIINGKKLTEAQTITVRVALNSFAVDMSKNGLEEDKTGKTMAQLYFDRVGEIRNIMDETKETKCQKPK